MIFITCAVTAIIVLAILISLNVRNKAATMAKERSMENETMTEQAAPEMDVPVESDSLRGNLEETKSVPQPSVVTVQDNPPQQVTARPTNVDTALPIHQVSSPSQGHVAERETRDDEFVKKPTTSISDQDYRAAMQRLLHPPQDNPIETPQSTSKDQDFREALKKLSERNKK